MEMFPVDHPPDVPWHLSNLDNHLHLRYEQREQHGRHGKQEASSLDERRCNVSQKVTIHGL
jgi:hypothetical protein